VARGKEGLKKLFAGSAVTDIPLPALDLLASMLSINASSRYTIEQVLDHPWLRDCKKKQRQKKESAPSSPRNCDDVNSVSSNSLSPSSSSNSLSPSTTFSDVSGERIFSHGLRHMSSDTSLSSGSGSSGSSTPEQKIISNQLERSQTGLAPRSQKKRAVKSRSAIFSLPQVQTLPSCNQGLVMKVGLVMKGSH